MSSDRFTPKQWAVSRWGDDPYSLGSWSYLRPGGSPEDRATLGEPVSDRVILAGEAVHRTRPAMVHGAYETGRAAAAWCGDAGSVIVVGAGAAGLGAAEVLGDRCVVVEARGRIGGRVNTVMLDGAIADLGAAWMQQYGDNCLAERAGELAIATVATDFSAPIVRAWVDGHAETVHEQYRPMKFAYARFVNAGDGDGSVALDPTAWLGSLDESARAGARRMIEGDLVIEAGAPTGELSSKWVFAEPGVGDGDRWLPGGYIELLDHLARSVDIRLHWPVDLVQYDRAGATVRGRRGALHAERVIVTVPVGALKQTTIDFDPPLPPGHLLALERIGMGTVEKVILRFGERWWPHDSNGYFRWFDEPTNFVEWLDLSDHAGAPVVAALISAPHTSGWYNDSSDFEIAMRATRALQRFAGMGPVP